MFIASSGDIETVVLDSRVRFLWGDQFCKQDKRVGVIPLEALCRDAYPLWISCIGERPIIVSGVTDYPLRDPECYKQGTPGSIVHNHTP